jgi:hypothetical protein
MLSLFINVLFFKIRQVELTKRGLSYCANRRSLFGGSAVCCSIHVCSTYKYSTHSNIASDPYCRDITKVSAPNAVRHSGAPIDMETLSRLPPSLPLICRLCPIRNGIKRHPPVKDFCGGRGQTVFLTFTTVI